MKFLDKLKNYIYASYPALWVTTHEEARICAEVFNTFVLKHNKAQLKTDSPFRIFEWDSVLGLFERLEGDKTKQYQQTDDPAKLFDTIKAEAVKGNSTNIFILKDFHLQFDKPLKRIEYIRGFKNLLQFLKAHANMVLFTSPIVKIPIELTKDIQLIDYSLPDAEAIAEQLEFIHESANADKKGKEKLDLPEDIKEQAVEAAKGMTDAEVESAYSLAIVENKGFNRGFIKTVFGEKIHHIKKSGMLTYLETDVNFEKVGGLDVVKDWVNMRRDSYTKRARDFKLPFPKGVGLAGVPGTGKTLISKAIANELGFPLFQLDIGSLFSKYVGDTESNTRELIKTIESIGHCVIQIDEVEKYMNTGATSGSGDSGTSSRSFGTILTWLGERNSPAFLICTSNNHLILPPAFTRKGRFDEWFWVDLPGHEEKEQIFGVVIKKYERDPGKFDVAKLAKAANQFSGAEIDSVVTDAMFRAFSENKDLNESHILIETQRITPHARMHEKEIDNMRAAADGKLRLATKYGKTDNASIVNDATHARKIRA